MPTTSTTEYRVYARLPYSDVWYFAATLEAAVARAEQLAREDYLYVVVFEKVVRGAWGEGEVVWRSN